jgi:Mg-chelatase subunit ChlD
MKGVTRVRPPRWGLLLALVTTLTLVAGTSAVLAKDNGKGHGKGGSKAASAADAPAAPDQAQGKGAGSTAPDAADASAALEQAGPVAGSKTLSATDISCNGAVDVTLTLTGVSGIAGDPEDIMLVLDRSDSMAGTPLANLKTAAKAFVDIIDEATDGILDGTIANGSRVGVVSFSDTATLNQTLTTNATALKSTIDALVASGFTNHEAAISLAQSTLAGSMPTNTKQMIVFTDGVTTAGGNPDDDAAAARAAGTEIFAIGLGTVNVGQLNAWATDPDSEHVFIAPTSANLQTIFEAIGAAITVPAATNVVVTDTINGHFSVSGPVASKGTVSQAGNVLTWSITELQTETVTLRYTATHDATTSGGVEQVNTSVVYSDAEGQTVTFPNPSVNVHGCAAAIELTPPTATNELTTGASHTVTATVTDDLGDPVSGVGVSFEVTAGPNAGATGSGTTGAGGTVPFTYPAAVIGPAGLGTDTIQACFTNGQGQAVCDTAQKTWVDTTPPVAACSPTTNPSGKNVPKAGTGTGSSGQNPDGFYELTATDVAGPVSITVGPFGPFPSGTKIKFTQAPGSSPRIKPGPGDIDWHITLPTDLVFVATDPSGNSTTVTCLVPPPPK